MRTVFALFLTMALVSGTSVAHADSYEYYESGFDSFGPYEYYEYAYSEPVREVQVTQQAITSRAPQKAITYTFPPVGRAVTVARPVTVAHPVAVGQAVEVAHTVAIGRAVAVGTGSDTIVGKPVDIAHAVTIGTAVNIAHTVEIGSSRTIGYAVDVGRMVEAGRPVSVAHAVNIPADTTQTVEESIEKLRRELAAAR